MTPDNSRQNPPIPEPLIKLHEYQHRVADWYSGHFESISPDPNETIAWFDGDAETASQFIAIGKGGDGSLYAIWIYDGKSVEEAPFVFLGSECVGNTVLADGITDFLSLLAIGYDELGFADWSVGVEEVSPILKEFRDWLKKEFGIAIPARGLEIIEAAKSRHPNLEEWVEKWQEKHFSSNAI
jgi:hypothetical protein